MSLKHTVTLVVGDWSGDGHRLTEKFFIKSNLSGQEIKQAHKVGCKKLKIKFEEICSEYQDSYLKFQDWKKLAKAGLKLENIFYSDYEFVEAEQSLSHEEDFSLTLEAFISIYLFLVKQGNSNFEYQLVDESEDCISIGGYGLLE